MLNFSSCIRIVPQDRRKIRGEVLSRCVMLTKPHMRNTGEGEKERRKAGLRFLLDYMVSKQGGGGDPGGGTLEM